MSRSRALGLVASAVLMALPMASHAGPPLLCFPYEIGGASSLPWGNDAFKKNSGYDASKVVADTVALLGNERDTLVRMETIRRAALYIDKDRARANELMGRLAWLALDAEAAGKRCARCWFDAGFAAATLRQAGAPLVAPIGREGSADGYAYIKRALELTPDDAAMQFGAAMIAFEHDRSAFKTHLRAAVMGTRPGSALARSIESNHACGAKSLDALRKELAAGGASPVKTGG